MYHTHKSDRKGGETQIMSTTTTTYNRKEQNMTTELTQNISELTQEEISAKVAEYKLLREALRIAGELPKDEKKARKRERSQDYFDVQAAMLTTVQAQKDHISKLFDLSITADTKKNIGATWITFKPENEMFGFAVISIKAEQAKRALQEAEKAKEEAEKERLAKENAEQEQEEIITEGENSETQESIVESAAE